MTDVAAHAHKLAGSAGTFGFRDIGDMAHELELLCGNLIEDARQPTAMERQMLVRLVVAIDERTLTGMAGLRAGAPSPIAAAATHNRIAPDLDVAVGDEVFLALGDDPAAERLATAVRAAGYKIRQASFEDVFAAAAGSSSPSAIIADLDAAAGIQPRPADYVQQARAPACPVIALASEGDFHSRLRGARIGCEELLIKPVSDVDVVAAIGRLADTAISQPYRVLVDDDDVDLASHTTLLLRHAGMIAEFIDDPTQVLERIAAFAPELLLVDLHMPVCTGAELSAVIRQQQEFAGIPIVFLSHETDAEHQVQALRRGGDEFLLKSVKARHLVAAVRARARRFRQLRSLLMRDSLTGLLNHATTQAMLEAELQRAKRGNLSLVLAIIDIDHFKKVNDIHGHGVGDEVIKRLAGLLRQGLRSSEIVGRVGGEEFAVTLGGTGIDQAIERLNALRQEFSDTAHRVGDAVLQTTFSCGMAAFPSFPDVKSLSKAADEALYAAKEAGRNRIAVSEKTGKGTGVVWVGP